MKRGVIFTVVAILVWAATYPTLAQTPQNIAVTNRDTVHIITWTDRPDVSGETYNVYMSEVPITNLYTSSAYLIGTQIPEGQQSYEYQLFTPSGSRQVTYYYAVTSTVAGIENTTIIPGENATTVGEDGTTTPGVGMIWFGEGGFAPPVCDGEIDEWGFFNIYLDPTSPDNLITRGEIDDANDLSGYLWCGADEEALYFAADITDDYLENTYPYDAGDVWRGDAVEFFLGLYDMRPSDPRHEDYGFTTEPDFQILIKANAGTDLCFHVYTNGKRTPGDIGITGTEQWCGSRTEGDLTSGYYIEAKLPYECLNWDPALPPVPHPKIGWVLPCNIMIDDTDIPGGVEREGQLSWSNDVDAGASWDRPDVWKHQVVIYAPPPLEIPTDINVINNQTVHTITWHDVEGLTGETYNVYMSESPITDVKAEGVFLIGTEIAEGEGSYEYQLYTPLQPGGDEVTYYYAVTSVVGGVENTLIMPGTNATTAGEAGTTTWGLAAIWFDDVHISTPVCNGDLSEWPEELSVFIDSISPADKITTDFIPPTVSGYFWCGVDEEALYFAADVTDDYLENIYSYNDGNMWKGDSPEYYLGLYDMRPSDPRHQDYQATTEPDFQIDIKANAGTDPCFHVYTNGKRNPGNIGITGTTQWCGPRIAGDLTSGYYIEAKLPYERLNWDPALPPVPHPKIGWVLPCNIMVNDCDTPGGPYREGQISWSDDPDAGASWDRPDVWKHQVVIYDPTRLANYFHPVPTTLPTNITVTNQNTVHTISWRDAAALSGETYNVYMSESPITDVKADDVYLIGTGISEGEGSYEYMLYTPDEPREVTYYYAVTVTSNAVENTAIVPGQNATTEGEPGTTTWALAMVWLDGILFHPPTFDGDLSDWAGYPRIYIDPTSPENKITAGVIDGPQDLSGYFYYAADQSNLYFAADVTDDYLVNIWRADQGDVWKGDGVEFYLGLYDQRPSDPPHDDYQVQPEPDYQILIKANAGTGSAFHIYTNGKTSTEGAPTVTEQWCGERIAGDPTSGWIVEAKLPYEALTWDPVAYPQVIRPAIGWVLPTNIGVNDADVPGLGEREGQLMWSNYDEAGTSWDRPDVWKHQVVIYDPKQLGPMPPPSIPTDISVSNNTTVHIITWTDADGLTGETYNVYMSESPITDVKADDVYLIGTGISEGEGSYEYMLYTPDEPREVTYYYAVTVTSNAVENTAIVPGQNATTEGEPGTTTWALPMVWMDGSVYSPPEFDGTLNEWRRFPSVYLDPTSPDNLITTGQIDGADDLSGYLWCGADREALYFAADITDDYLENIYSYDDADMWKGDVVEFYLGLYDLRPSDAPHEDFEITTEPDFMIDIKSNSGTNPCFHVYTNGKRNPSNVGITGTEQWCGPRIPGDLTSGYYVEAKLPYEGLNWDPALPPVPHPQIGWVLPCNIMIRDNDTPGGVNQEGQLSWSNHPEAGASWDRPDVWKHQVVIYDPKLLHSIEQATISYQIQIAAYSDVTNDLYNYAGVSPNATSGFDAGLDQPEPPPAPANYLQLYFPHPEWNHNLGERFCRDIRPKVDLSHAALVWNFVIETDLSNQTITVCVRPEWDKIPPNYGLMLKDLDNDVLQDLRADTSAYQYVSAATRGQHHFQLIVGNTSIVQSQKFLTAGWNLISLPLNPEDFSKNSILGDDIPEAYYVMGFRPAVGYFPVDTLQLGWGYWIGTTQTHTVDIEGKMLTEAVSIPLEKGYNLIGNPFPFNIDRGNFFFVKNGRHLSTVGAANEGWIQDVFYTFAAEDSGYSEVNLLEPWQAVWIPVLVDSVELRIEPLIIMSKAVTFGKEKDESVDVSSWRLALAATTDKASDLLTQLGVEAAATDGFDPSLDYCEPPPPPGGDYVEVYFRHPEWGALPSICYNRDIRAPLEDKETKVWNLEIHTNNTGMVKLQWSAQVPDGHRFLLVDLDDESENYVNMRESQSYAYFSTGLRHFRIEVTYSSESVGKEDSPNLPDCFKISQNYPNPFNPNTHIDYALPKASHVVIEIYNLAGQKVVTLVDEDALPGSYSVCWNGCDWHGRAVASGVYLCRMHAKTLGGSPLEFTDRKKLILLK